MESRLWNFVKRPWLGCALLLFGWVPLLILGVFSELRIIGPHAGVGEALGWVIAVTLPCTILGALLVLILLVRVLVDIRKSP
jgi:hypothetical protein